MKLSRALRLTPGDVLALTGGGGKSTAMFRLADELANEPDSRWRVLMTTSTRIFASQIKLAPAHVVFDPQQQDIGDILPRLLAALDVYGRVLLVGPAGPGSDKAFGIPPETIDALAGTGHFDLIINEADGSRMRPFKAPAAHEPVIPACTTIVTPVVGLDVLGQPLNDDTVHRAGQVSQLSNLPAGHPVTIHTVQQIICHPQGGLKNVPAPARVVPLLNKVDTLPGPAPARQLAAQLLACNRLDAVAIGAVQLPNRPITEVFGRIATVILAAGGASRFGSPKQLARWGRQTLLERVVDLALASHTWPVVVVLGAEVDQCRAVLKDRPVQIVVNPDWAAGQSTSMKAGLSALPGNTGGAIFLLADQPGVTAGTVGALIHRHRQTLAPLVWPEFEGRRGNPVLFDRSLFPELMQITGDTGGRPLFRAYQHRAERVSVADAGILLDVDRPEDLNTLRPEDEF